jgi:glycyl-tRNA synthetase
MAVEMEKIVALCKRRGFIYAGSEIYGGFANSYTYGPYGSALKKNVKDLWWKMFVTSRRDVVGIDGPILLHPKTWHASGHVAGFNDALVDCKECKARHRADHLIENATGKDAEGLSVEELTKIIVDEKVKCPKCGKQHFTEARHFNLMFKTQLSKTQNHSSENSSGSGQAEDDDMVYLRPETAQAIFTEFKNIVDTQRVKIPFGIAQIGKAFRNEITPGNFIFRLLEFEAMEVEYFIREEDWEQIFEDWLNTMKEWCAVIGLDKDKLSDYEHPKEKLCHYSKRTVDIMYDYPFGRSELYGLAYRTDFDLKQHAEFSGKKLEYHDQVMGERFVPHVVEPALGVDRTILALLIDSYDEDDLPPTPSLSGGGADSSSVKVETRIVMRFDPKVAPVKVAFLPLMKKDGMAEKAQELYDEFSHRFVCEYDDGGAIGKRYRRQDEIGTPYCVTVDYETLEEGHKDFGTVTVRERDSMQQDRVKVEGLSEFFAEKLG